MKTTYKKLALLQKGYPTPFWIAFSDSHISREKPTSFRRTGSSFYTLNPLIGLHTELDTKSPSNRPNRVATLGCPRLCTNSASSTTKSPGGWHYTAGMRSITLKFSGKGSGGEPLFQKWFPLDIPSRLLALFACQMTTMNCIKQ